MFKKIYEINYKSFFNYRRLNRFLQVIKFINRIKPGKTLDMGCGAGAYVAFLKNEGYDVLGIDNDDNAARQGILKNLPIKKENIYDGKYDKEFDLVMMNDVIEHLDHPKKAINIAYNSLKDGGFLIMTIPTEHYERFFHKYNPGHKESFSTKKILDMISKKFNILDKLNIGGWIERKIKQMDYKVHEYRGKAIKTKLSLKYKYFIFPILYFLLKIDRMLYVSKPLHIVVLGVKKDGC